LAKVLEQEISSCMPPLPLAFEHDPSGRNQELNPELTRHITPGSLDRISPTSRQ
jgi:hypothetical protein